MSDQQGIQFARQPTCPRHVNDRVSRPAPVVSNHRAYCSKSDDHNRYFLLRQSNLTFTSGGMSSAMAAAAVRLHPFDNWLHVFHFAVWTSISRQLMWIPTMVSTGGAPLRTARYGPHGLLIVLLSAWFAPCGIFIGHA